MHGFTKHWKQAGGNDRRCCCRLDQSGKKLWVMETDLCAKEKQRSPAQSVSGQLGRSNGNAGGSVSDKININTAAKKN